MMWLFHWYKKPVYPGIKLTMSEPDPRRMLGAFLRAHRERLSPPAPSGGRRRTPGLRREELADAAGVGVTWITWLEQGRAVSPSPAALARLAGALRLSAAERAALFDLAGKRDPAPPPEPHLPLPPEVLALPGLFEVPAYLLDPLWTARAWNAAAARLFAGWLDGEAERNLLRFVFLSEAAPRLIEDWPQRAARLAAEFRADYGHRPRDPAMRALADELAEKSPLFADCWREFEVLRREGGERSFHHPEEGALRFLQTTLVPAAYPDCKLVCLVPA
jgi:transcriptional regulator with XRE-family HTH domain